MLYHPSLAPVEGGFFAHSFFGSGFDTDTNSRMDFSGTNNDGSKSMFFGATGTVSISTPATLNLCKLGNNNMPKDKPIIAIRKATVVAERDRLVAVLLVTVLLVTVLFALLVTVLFNSLLATK